MLRYLKQHGTFLFYRLSGISRPLGVNPFFRRYVVEREIPIPKLLEAFGMYLVRVLCCSLSISQGGTSVLN